VLFQALEGGASYDLYIRDAEEAGDEELATFFIQVRDEDSMRAEEAQRLLAERTPAANKRGGTAAAMAEGAAAGLSPSMEPSSPPPRTAGELPPIREGGASSVEPISGAPGTGDKPSGRAEEAPLPGPEPRDNLPRMDPIAEGAPSGDARRETAVTRTPEQALTVPGEDILSDVLRAGEVTPERAADKTPTLLRTEGSPVAQEVPSGTPP
jgi:hypothetical protein